MLKVQNTLEHNVAAMAALWYDSSTAVLEKLFDGSEDSLKSMTNLLEGGKLQQNGYAPPTADVLSTHSADTLYRNSGACPGTRLPGCTTARPAPNSIFPFISRAPQSPVWLGLLADTDPFKPLE